MTTIETRKKDINTLILSFFLGGTIGGGWETIWTYLRHGLLQWKSGVMFFPLCNPIYGIGAMLITIYAMKEKNNLKRYIFSFASCTLAEFFFSYAQQLVFKTISWDYSSHFLNIQGRVNLVYSLFWGLLGLLWSDMLLPHVEKYGEENPEKTEAIILVLITSYSALLFLSIIGMFIKTYHPELNLPLFSPSVMDFFYPSLQIAP